MKWATNTVGEAEMWGQVLLAPRDAAASTGVGCSVKLGGVKSLRCQTPVGTDCWQLLVMGRRKAGGRAAHLARAPVTSCEDSCYDCDLCFCDVFRAEVGRCWDVLGTQLQDVAAFLCCSAGSVRGMGSQV